MIIGVTGSFGTGKSFVASIFKRFGAKIIDADLLARRALRRNSPSYKKALTTFGDGILGNGRSIDRRRLAEIVFTDRTKLEKLNRIIHPEVIKDIKAAIARSANGEAVVIDAPLLVEANMIGLVDKLVVVESSRKVQVERCMKKFGIKKGDILKRIRSQIHINKKIEMADFVIDNGGTRSETRKQAVKVWGEIIYGNSRS